MEKNYYTEYFQIENSHWWFEGRRAIFATVIESQPAMRLPLRWLDVGCGTGTTLDHFRKYGAGIGLDFSYEAVQYCALRGVRPTVPGAVQSLPFCDECFDLVTALDVLEHLDHDLAALSEIRRVLHPSGYLLLSVPALMILWGRQDIVSHHKRRYTAKQVRNRLRMVGFEVTTLSYFNTILFPPIALVRILRRGTDRLFSREAQNVQSDFGMTPSGPFNKMLGGLFSLERHLVTRMKLPIGVSILALARRPSSAHQ